MHLAELNISKWKVDPTSSVASGFMDNLTRINSLAERSPGFVWRLVEEERDAKGCNAVCDGPETIVNLSVWESASDLEHFVWNTVHKKIYQGRNQWFAEMESHAFVMWHVEKNHQPTLEEAAQRLDHLRQIGDSEVAFGWSYLPHVKLWQKQRCGLKQNSA